MSLEGGAGTESRGESHVIRYGNGIPGCGTIQYKALIKRCDQIVMPWLTERQRFRVIGHFGMPGTKGPFTICTCISSQRDCMYRY